MPAAPYDTLIRHARVIDGSGAPWFRACVGLRGGRVATLDARPDAPAREVVEAGEHYLSPGFIDSHTHDDSAVLRDPLHPSKLRQGVTTVVVGNCSFSTYPARSPELRGHYRALLGETPEAQFFPDFRAYAEALNRQGCALNVLSLVGHAALRLAVLGYDPRPATPAERAEMGALLAEQLRQGAAGLSLGLVYPPSAYADRAELLALAQTVQAHGRLLTAHIRSYEGGLLDSVQEFIGLLRESGARGLLSHLQAAGQPYWGSVQTALEQIEAARAEGVDLSVDMYPYPAGSSTVTQLLPPSAQAGGLGGLVEALRDPLRREALRAATEGGREAGWESKVRLIGYQNIQIGGVLHPSLKPLEGLRLSEAARLRGTSPFDLLADMIELDGGASNIIMFQLSEADLQAVFRHRLHMLGSDSIPRCGGRPHPRMYGSLPRLLGRFVRAGLLPLEEAVRRVTSLPAQRFGLWDRGLIRPGAVADLCLFSPHFSDHATFEAPSLPPSGLSGVWVAGVRSLDHDQQRDVRPGVMLTPSASQEAHHA